VQQIRDPSSQFVSHHREGSYRLSGSLMKPKCLLVKCDPHMAQLDVRF